MTFSGLNMDVGHVRSIRWVKDDNPSSPINNDPELTANGKSAAQNRLIAYNKGKGQYNSAMEHTTPEEFWVDKTQCRYTNSNGQVQNPSLNACAEGISAVKAIAIAQSQGQKIYTINQDNRDTALPKLTIGGEAGAEIRNAINAGKEVTFHESSSNAHGWSGHGYIIVDPDTGAGAYLIEGGGNGGELSEDIVSRALTMNQLSKYVLPSLGFANDSLSHISNVVSYVALTFTTMLDCYKEAIINTILLAITIAVVVALYKSVIGAPVGVTLSLVLAPLTVKAQGSTDNCYVDCKFATPPILRSTAPEPIFGKEHIVKTEYGAIPNSRFDICAFRDGGIVIWKHDMCGSIKITDMPIITHYYC